MKVRFLSLAVAKKKNDLCKYVRFTMVVFSEKMVLSFFPNFFFIVVKYI